MNEIIKNNRITAIVFRGVAIILCLFGLLDGMGLFSGGTNATALLYYTNQSNILVLGMFIVLIIFSLKDVTKNGIKGSSSYCERATGIIMLTISVTMIIFWLVLAPVMIAGGMGTSYMLSFANLQLHLITPLLIIIDYFVFEKPGMMKKQDPWYFAAIPLLYLIQATILGFSGVVYSTLENGEVQHFPYYFLDYNTLGWKVGVYIVVVLIFFVSLAYGLLFFDKKRAKAVAKKQMS
ncbi:MAG: hypothetical protein LBF68_08035 [Christensenellaceae bacterium]|jgi:uncharacterized membrane protein|nr:hypothetical protein [Christensenellaceae bacterium]